MDSAELPPLWLQHRTLPKLSNGSQVQWVGKHQLDLLCILRTDNHLICAQIHQTDNLQLQVVSKVELPSEDPTLCVAASVLKDSLTVITSHRSTLFRLWIGKSLELSGSFKAQHLGPTVLMEFSPCSESLFSASSSVDMSVKAWNLSERQCLQTFRPVISRPTAMKVFQKESVDEEFVAIGTVEGMISVWKRGQDKAVQLKKHVSPVSCIEYAHGRVIAGGRDQILTVWDTNSWECLKVIATFENVNTMKILSDELKAVFQAPNAAQNDYIMTGSQGGKLRMWNISTFQEIPNAELQQHAIQDLPLANVHCQNSCFIYQQEDVICVVPAEGQKGTYFCLNEFEVTDLAIVADNYIVVASSSPILRCYDASDNFALSVAKTNDEVTLTLAACRKGQPFFCSSGREKVVHVWKISKKRKEMKLMTSVSGHTGNVKGLLLIDTILLSGDQDGVLKMWSFDGKRKTSSALNTKICHDKELTCLDVHLSKGLLVTGSLNKEIRVMNLEHLDDVIVLTGHRRGISALSFSEYEHVLATGSLDMTVKLWHTTTYECLQTIEGLPAAVTKCLFLNKNCLASTNAAGHLSFHDCLVGSKEKPSLVFEGHEEPVWGLVKYGEELITGGKDCNIIFWRDNSDAVEKEKVRQKEVAIQHEQALANCVTRGDIAKAVNLSIKLDKPQHTLKYLSQANSEGKLAEVLESVKPKFLPRLVGYVGKWNTMSRQVEVAQLVMKFMISRDLLTEKDSSVLQGMLMYSEKHYARLDSLYNKLAIVDNLLNDYQ